MADQTQTLNVTARTPEGSRATRRLRRQGKVPGVLYGRDIEPVAFAVDARELRHALHASGAVLDVTIEGKSTPAVLKNTQRHPVRGETTHVDLLRVDLSKPIQAVVTIELTGADDTPGVREGGVLDQPLREANVEALPTDIPESIQVDVSTLAIGESVALSAASIPSGVTLLDDIDTVVATVLIPRLRVDEEIEGGIEQETEVVGEGEADDAADAGDDAGDK